MTGVGPAGRGADHGTTTTGPGDEELGDEGHG